MLFLYTFLFGTKELFFKKDFSFIPFGTNESFTVLPKGGDFDGDGRSDLLVQRTLSPTSSVFYLYKGGDVFDTIPDDSLKVESHYIVYGTMLDVNGDKIKDLIVSEYNYESLANAGCGRVRIYLAGQKFKDVPDFTIIGDEIGAPDAWNLNFGESIRGNIDINGDGYDDLIISGDGPSMFNNGLISIFFGGPDFDNIPDWLKIGEISESIRIITSFDYNNDGYADIFSKRITSIETYESVIDVYKGGPVISDSAYITLSNSMGYCRRFPDLNGDGIEELYYKTNHDTATIFFGNKEFDFSEVLKIPLDSITYAVSFMDIDGDNVPELRISNRAHDAEPYHTSYYYKTGEGFDTIPEYKVTDIYPQNCGNIYGDEKSEFYLPDYVEYNYKFGHMVSDTTSISDESVLNSPDNFNISVYPNPSNSSSQINFIVDNSDNISMKIYNVKGEVVKTLSDKHFNRGSYSFKFDGTGLISGVYFLQIKNSSGIKESKKLMMIK